MYVFVELLSVLLGCWWDDTERYLQSFQCRQRIQGDRDYL